MKEGIREIETFLLGMIDKRFRIFVSGDRGEASSSQNSVITSFPRDFPLCMEGEVIKGKCPRRDGKCRKLNETGLEATR